MFIEKLIQEHKKKNKKVRKFLKNKLGSFFIIEGKWKIFRYNKHMIQKNTEFSRANKASTCKVI